MLSFLPYAAFPLGDRALTIDFGNVLLEEINLEVLRIFNDFKNDLPPGIIEVFPAYSSLAFYYDPEQFHPGEGETAMDKVLQIIEGRNIAARSIKSPTFRTFKIPVCYSKGLDLEKLANEKQVTANTIIQWHTSRSYRVFMTGFLPGFAYMGTVNELLATPRRPNPRKEVPAGAVGVAGSQTGIYPLASPGGWQLIGQTPMKIFDKSAKNPVLLQPGDEIIFYSITEDEFADYQGRPA